MPRFLRTFLLIRLNGGREDRIYQSQKALERRQDTGGPVTLARDTGALTCFDAGGGACGASVADFARRA